MELPKQLARNVVTFLTGFGPFMKHFYNMDPDFYKTDECRVCNEGGSVGLTKQGYPLRVL